MRRNGRHLEDLKCVLVINFHAEIIWNIAVFRNTPRKYCERVG